MGEWENGRQGDGETRRLRDLQDLQDLQDLKTAGMKITGHS